MAGESGVPLEENSDAELLPELASQALPRPSNARDVGVDKPPPEYGDVPSLLPFEESSVTVELPELAIQVLPEVSICNGRWEVHRPGGEWGSRCWYTRWLSSVTELFPEFAIHKLPDESMAIAEGALMPPAL